MTAIESTQAESDNSVRSMDSGQALDFDGTAQPIPNRIAHQHGLSRISIAGELPVRGDK